MGKHACVVCYRNCKVQERVNCRGHFTCRHCLYQWYKLNPSREGTCSLCFCPLRGWVPPRVRKQRRIPVQSTIDPLTQEWLSEHTKACPSCSVCIQKSGGCRFVSCHCGARFCWECQEARCRCSFTNLHVIRDLLDVLFGALLFWVFLCWLFWTAGLIVVPQNHNSDNQKNNQKNNWKIQRVNLCNTSFPSQQVSCQMWENVFLEHTDNLVQSHRLNPVTNIVTWQDLQEMTRMEQDWRELQPLLQGHDFVKAQHKWGQWRGTSLQTLLRKTKGSKQHEELLQDFRVYWDGRFGIDVK